VRAGLRSPRFPQRLLTSGTRRKQFGFLSQASCLNGQAVFKLIYLGETASFLLHRVLGA
jgi:hypothetical protein